MLKSSELRKFHNNGYLKFQVTDKKFLRSVRCKFLETLKNKNLTINNIQKNYHKIFCNLKDHHKVQSHFQKYILDNKIHFKLIKNYNTYFSSILGLDICATTSVNFRIVRPTKNIDNIGFHRDTDLGHTPYEVNVWVPLFSTNKNNSLHILPETHKKKLNFFKFTKLKTGFKRRSKENAMGYLYRSFKFKNLKNNLLKPIKCDFGNILIFYSSCMHGTRNNNSKETRFSFDFNISNSFFPIKWTHHGKEKKYQKVLESNVSLNAKSII